MGRSELESGECRSPRRLQAAHTAYRAIARSSSAVFSEPLSLLEEIDQRSGNASEALVARGSFRKLAMARRIIYPCTASPVSARSAPSRTGLSQDCSDAGAVRAVPTGAMGGGVGR